MSAVCQHQIHSPDTGIGTEILLCKIFPLLVRVKKCARITHIQLLRYQFLESLRYIGLSDSRVAAPFSFNEFGSYIGIGHPSALQKKRALK